MPRILTAFLFALAATPAFACNGDLYDMLNAEPAGQPDASFDVAEVGSTEGGEWKVWLAADGRTARDLQRHDYGEGGRRATRLVVNSPAAFAITDTDVAYSAPNYISGSIPIREVKDIYVFCDGRLLLPEEEGFGPDPAYVEASKAALATFDAAEVKQYVKGLRR